MTSKQESDSISPLELKLIRLIDRLEAMQGHCDALSAKIEKDIAWKHDIRIIEHDLLSMGQEMRRTSNTLTWLIRAVFGAMMTAGVGTVVWLVQSVGG